MERIYQANAFSLVSWIIIGLVLDIVFHTQNKWESVWLMPHLITNSGIVAIIVSLVWILLRNNGMDQSLLKYIKKLGIFVFLLGAVGDIILHLMDIPETSFISRPTHLLILLGGGLYLFNWPTINKRK